MFRASRLLNPCVVRTLRHAPTRPPAPSRLCYRPFSAPPPRAPPLAAALRSTLQSARLQLTASVEKARKLTTAAAPPATPTGMAGWLYEKRYALAANAGCTFLMLQWMQVPRRAVVCEAFACVCTGTENAHASLFRRRRRAPLSPIHRSRYLCRSRRGEDDVLYVRSLNLFAVGFFTVYNLSMRAWIYMAWDVVYTAINVTQIARILHARREVVQR